MTPQNTKSWLEQAADEIERLQRDVTGYMEICNQQITTVEKLRETLRPFAKKYNSLSSHLKSEWDDIDRINLSIKLGYLRKAAEVLKDE